MTEQTPITTEFILAKIEQARRENNVKDYIYWEKILDTHQKFVEVLTLREKLIRAERQLADARKKPQCDPHYTANLREYITAARAALNETYAK